MSVKLWFKQHSPELLLASGIINSAAAVVTACVATLQVSKKVIEPSKQKTVELHNRMEMKSLQQGATPEDLKLIKQEITKNYIRTGAKVALYYAPSVLAFSLSVASMVGSHNIMKGRNIALASAFTALKSSYDLYREKVKDKIGKEAEEALFQDHESREIKKKNSKGQEITKTVSSPKLDNDNLFGAWWGPGNDCYEPQHLGSLNMTTLLQKEVYLNQKLRAKGCLFLSDVYDELGYTPSMLGERKTQASRVLGWIFNPKDESRNSYVDFGIHDSNGQLTEAAKDFQAGISDFIWLNFNVDGDIVTGEDGHDTFMKYAMKKS